MTSQAMPKYVAIIQQGMVIDQKAVGVGADMGKLQAKAAAAAKKRNAAETGFGEGWTGVVLEVK